MEKKKKLPKLTDFKNSRASKQATSLTAAAALIFKPLWLEGLPPSEIWPTMLRHSQKKNIFSLAYELCTWLVIFGVEFDDAFQGTQWNPVIQLWYALMPMRYKLVKFDLLPDGNPNRDQLRKIFSDSKIIKEREDWNWTNFSNELERNFKCELRRERVILSAQLFECLTQSTRNWK